MISKHMAYSALIFNITLFVLVTIYIIFDSFYFCKRCKLKEKFENDQDYYNSNKFSLKSYLRLPWLNFKSYQYPSKNAGFIIIDRFFILYGNSPCKRGENDHDDPRFRFQCTGKTTFHIPPIFQNWLAGLSLGYSSGKNKRNPFIVRESREDRTRISVGKRNSNRSYCFIIWGYIDNELIEQNDDKKQEKRNDNWASENKMPSLS